MLDTDTESLDGHLLEPESFTFPDEAAKWAKYHESLSKRTVFIAKPKHGSEGNNCLLFEDLKDLPQSLV